MEKIVTKEKQFYHLDRLGLLISCYCQANQKWGVPAAVHRLDLEGVLYFFMLLILFNNID